MGAPTKRVELSTDDLATLNSWGHLERASSDLSCAPRLSWPQPKDCP